MVQKTLNWFDRFKLFVEPRHVVIRNVVITFLQGFLVAWALTNYSFDEGSLFGAGVAGLSAVWNLILKPWLIQHGYMKA